MSKFYQRRAIFIKKLIWLANGILILAILALIYFIAGFPDLKRARTVPEKDVFSESFGENSAELIFSDVLNQSNVQQELLEAEDWAFFIINEENLLAENYGEELCLAPIGLTGNGDNEASNGDNWFLDERAAPYAIKMLENARKDGINLNIVSAFRSNQKQSEVFDNYVKTLTEQGLSESEARDIASAQIASPGASEHNAGLAIDILAANWWDENDDITADFDKTKEFKWLSRNSWKYGFILRYPKGKETITGFDYEPWHYRYIGSERAETAYYSNLCLEEYMEIISNEISAD